MTPAAPATLGPAPRLSDRERHVAWLLFTDGRGDFCEDCDHPWREDDVTDYEESSDGTRHWRHVHVWCPTCLVERCEWREAENDGDGGTVWVPADGCEPFGRW